jgi:glycerol-1-phosphate dehydrogenase [NAD(P)+]
MKPSSTNEIRPGKYFARSLGEPSAVFLGNSLVSDTIFRSEEPLLFLGDANTLAALWRVGAGARAGDRVVDLGQPLRLDDTLFSAARQLVGADDGRHLVAVGGGTINDLAKLLAAESGRSFTLVASCASMNGWTSANASIVRNGNKISVPAVAPQRVLLDEALLRGAPKDLTAAGFADAVCGGFACRDWLLAHLADGVAYDASIASAVERSLAPLRAGLANATPLEALLPCLVDALLTGGLAMTEAHTSSPASGAEHLVAHAIDLLEIARGAAPTLHGHAVAVGTLLVAALWEVVGEHLGSVRVAAAPAPRAPSSVRADALGAFLPTLAKEARALVHAKEAREAARLPVHARCTTLTQLAPMPSVAEVRRWLTHAGAPTRAREVGIERAFAKAALSSACDMRDRTTVLDLAYDLGVLPARAEEVLTRSGLFEP